MRGRWIGLLFILFLSTAVLGQGLFEEAEGSQDQEKAFELNGYMRSTLYLGEVPESNQGEIKSGYGEFSLKLKASKASFGSAFTEVRFRKGYEFNDYVTEFTVREAYVNAYLGPFDFRIGHQIVAWGRADGINPTDNITPKNMLVRSPDEDDRREANFLLRTFFNAHPVRIELIWVPFFRSSVVPTNLIPFPSGISLADPDYPDASLKNGAVAAKLNLELAALDFSFSYFNGHYPFAGISYSFPDPLSPALDIFLKSFRVNVLGADFSTTVGGFGLRGEAGYTIPYGDYQYHVHVPNPDLHYILGVDKEFSGGFSIIFQYIGRTVLDFTPLVAPPVFIPIPAYSSSRPAMLSPVGWGGIFFMRP
jgi:hypothetical protein